MKKRKLTKRQILNELLAVKEKQEKVYASQLRLSNREETLDDQKMKLADELKEICLKERVKNGNQSKYFGDEDPILFKNHVFTIISAGWSSTDIQIVSVNHV